MNKIYVLIIVNNAMLRITLRTILEKYPDLDIIGLYKYDEKILNSTEKKPDVILIDLDIIKDKGIQILKRFFKIYTSIPYFIISMDFHNNSDLSFISLKALDLGVIDIIHINNFEEMDKIEFKLLNKIRAVKNIKFNKLKNLNKKFDFPVRLSNINVSNKLKYRAVLIGISTGGPQILQEMLPLFPANFPLPIVIAQHMPYGFTKAMADRLDKICQLNVVEAEDGDILESGEIFIGKGGYHIKIMKDSSKIFLKITKEPVDALYHPQIDILFETAAKSLDGRVIAVIMSGMGSDGTKGLKILKEKGAYVIAQDESSSVIFGMPRVAIENGVVDNVLPFNKMPEEIIKKLK